MSTTQRGYAYLWEYSVHPNHIVAFEEAYGPDGHWVRLFRGSPGYIRTELYRDRRSPNRYVTVDHWESVEAWQTFRALHSEEFDALDRRCEAFTTSEREIGRFDPVP